MSHRDFNGENRASCGAVLDGGACQSAATPIGLDDLLDSRQAGAWLGLSERELLAKSKGHDPKILAYRLNQRLVRWHPRAVLTKMASEAGLSPQLIAAMFAAPLLSDEVVRGVKQRWTGGVF